MEEEKVAKETKKEHPEKLTGQAEQHATWDPREERASKWKGTGNPVPVLSLFTGTLL